MTPEAAFEMLMQKIMQKIPVSVFVGKAVNIDKDKGICDVEREDMPALYNVRIDAIAGKQTGLTVYPKPGSYVICLMVEGSLLDACLLLVSEVDEIRLGGKTEGGIIVAGELLKRLNAIEKSVKGLINSFKLHTHPVAGSSAGVIVPTPVISDPGTTKEGDLESKKVFQ